MSKVKQFDFPGGMSRLNADGSEMPDPRPMEVPVGFEKPESIQSLIKRLVTDPAIRESLLTAGAESFEDADDFEIPDDEPVSPHEENFDPMHLLSREQEVMSGTVRARTPEEVAAARNVLADHKAALAAAKLAKATAPVAAAPEKG